ncbi:MAG: protease HtpX [Gammaproteobacteria bacterium]
MIRILLFVVTNLAILLLLSLVLKLSGLEQMLAAQGAGMNLTSLLIMAAVVGMSGSFISLLISKWMAKRSMGVRVVEQPSDAMESWLVDTIGHLARRAGIGMPEVGVFDSDAPNAFATGANKNKALVAVSSGLLRRMRKDEVEAVLGHEISHIANGDMVTLSLIQGVVNTFVFFLARVIGMLVDRVVFRNENNRGGYGMGYWMVTMVAQTVLGVLAMMVVMWFSRWREFRADAGGARLASRDKMIAALERLRAASEPEPLPGQFQAFGISGPRSGWAKLLMTHPPLEERIAALRNLQV